MFRELHLFAKFLYILLFPVLVLLSLLYSLITSFRNLLFDLGVKKPKVLDGKVISIGNLDIGGTGKTPVTIRIGEYLLSQGYSVSVLTRGYRSGLGSDEGIWIKDGSIHPLSGLEGRKLSEIYPDEPRLISLSLAGCWVVVGANRVRMADLFLKQTGVKIDWWILDDGFQHRGIHRDVDMVLIDSKRSVSSWCIPVGRSRENVSGLRRASVFLFTRASSNKLSLKNKKITDRFSKPSYSVEFKTNKFLLVDRLEDRFSTKEVDVSFFKGKKISVVSAISKNDLFVEEVARVLGISKNDFFYSFFLRDHSRFNASLGLDTRKLDETDLVITTGKDYFRDPSFFRRLQASTVILSLEVVLSDSQISKILVKKEG